MPLTVVLLQIFFNLTTLFPYPVLFSLFHASLDVDVSRLLSGEIFPAMLLKFAKLLWGPFFVVIYSLQVAQDISVRQNDVYRQWPL